MLLTQRIQQELGRLTILQFSFDMVASDKPSKSSQTRRSTRSGDESMPVASTSTRTDPNPTPSVPSTSSTSYSTINPYTFMNNHHPPMASHDGVYFSGHLQGSLPTSNLPRIQIPGIDTFPSFPQAHLLSQSQTPMWPFTEQSFASHPPGMPPNFMNHQQLAAYQYPASHPNASGPGTHISPVVSPSQMPSPTSSSQGQSPGHGEPEEAAILEDKRRRNTAASARFRIKKKQKSLNLERTVSDLTSRAEELEREATNLRRENSWLKEMVIMKGRQNLGQHSRAQPKRTSGDSDEDSDREEGSDSSDKSDSDDVECDTKGKGKSKAKSKLKAKSRAKGKGKKKRNEEEEGSGDD